MSDSPPLDVQAIIDGINENKVNGEIALVLSNHSKAYILERAKNNNIPCEFVSAKDLSREAYDAIVCDVLCTHPVVDPETP